jgi:hypothetical protein
VKRALIAVVAALLCGTAHADNQQQFLGLCTGLTARDSDTLLLERLSCMARIRGYADGHTMTVQFAASRGKYVPKLWCIPPTTTDQQVLSNVLGWVDRNPKQFTELTTKYPNITGAMAVITVALHRQYECK